MRPNIDGVNWHMPLELFEKKRKSWVFASFIDANIDAGEALKLVVCLIVLHQELSIELAIKSCFFRS